MIEAVLFDFGGVITTSPFDAFGRYEAAHDLPAGLIRTINSTNPDDNAWARLERSDVDIESFVELFEAEARALGHTVDGTVVLSLIGGAVRPRMVDALRRIRTAGFRTACVTNNFRAGANRAATGEVMALFDEVIESSVIGIRKPEPEFYRRALAVMAIEAHQALYLDDLGINLKPARALGMTTIKVLSEDQALADLSAALGLELT